MANPSSRTIFFRTMADPSCVPLIQTRASCFWGRKTVAITAAVAFLVFCGQSHSHLGLSQRLAHTRALPTLSQPQVKYYVHQSVSSNPTIAPGSRELPNQHVSKLQDGVPLQSLATTWSPVTVASLMSALAAAMAVVLALGRRQPDAYAMVASSGEAAPAAPSATADGQADDAQVDQQEGSPKAQLEVELEQVKARLAEVEKKYLYALAEIETVRRRGRQQTEDAQKFGIEKFAVSLLEVADNMARGLAWVPKEVAEGPSGEENPNPALRSLWGGMKSTEKIMLNVLEKHGIQKYDPLGEIYDPNLARAVAQVPNAENEPGTVLQVVSAGYTLSGRVLRPADVVVVQDPDQ